jgi:hypothetical protein
VPFNGGLCCTEEADCFEHSASSDHDA